jgi:small subunit ribosomal protein S9
MATKKDKGDESVEPVAAEDAVGAQDTPSEEQQAAEQEAVAAPTAEAPAAEPGEEAAPAAEAVAEDAAPAEQAPAAEPDADDEPATPRVKPAIPGMDLEVDIVREGESSLRTNEYGYPIEDDEEEAAEGDSDDEDVLPQPITAAAVDLAAGARYTATGKRKTACARVILKPGTGTYSCNGRTLEQYFPRQTVQRTVRQALETVGLEDKIDVVASIHGGGMTAQAGALRHGISRALVDADPNLRSELKRRGFMTRDARVKERKKAGLKKARKRPQFSKR